MENPNATVAICENRLHAATVFRDGRVPVGFRVPSARIPRFSFPFHVPAFHNAIVFAVPRAPAFLFRVPMLPQFTHKALSGAQLPVQLRYNGGGGRYGEFSSEYPHLGVLPGGGGEGAPSVSSLHRNANLAFLYILYN